MKIIEQSSDKSLSFYLNFDENNYEKIKKPSLINIKKFRTLQSDKSSKNQFIESPCQQNHSKYETVETEQTFKQNQTQLRQDKIQFSQPQKQHKIYLNQNLKKEHFSSSLYDNFQFVDRLTNNKLAYRQARRTSNSLSNLRNHSKIQDHKISSLLSIYKKTKNFSMASLKQKIFKKPYEKYIEIQNKNIQKFTLKEDTQVFQSNQNQKNSQLYQKKQKIGSIRQLKNYLRINKTNSKSNHKQHKCGKSFIQKSNIKNRIRQFIDNTVDKINQSQFHRIIKSQSNCISQDIISINANKKMLKSQLKQKQILKINEFKEKQMFLNGLLPNYNIKDQPFVFKDLSKFQSHYHDNQQFQTFLNRDAQSSDKSVIKIQANSSKQKDKFIQKMLIHAHNRLKKQGQYLIKPTKEIQGRKILIKKGNRKLNSAGYKNLFIKTQYSINEALQNGLNISDFKLKNNPQSNLIHKLKLQIGRRSQKYNTIDKQNQNLSNLNSQVVSSNQSLSKQQRQRKLNQKQIIYLLKHNFVSNLSIQLGSNPKLSETKDEKGNNLLHMAIKQEKYQILQLVLKKFNYKICKELLQQKNNNKKNPKQLSQILCDRKALQIIQNYQKQNISNEIYANYINY